MLIGVVTLALWLLGFFLVLFLPVQRRWRDDGDCREIIWHTIRAPSAIERFTLWESRYYLLKEYPDGRF